MCRLYNIESLLIKELLIPDSRIRISGFGVTYVRDTRKNCLIEYTILDIIAKGEVGEPCKYNATDPTDGSYITAEYNVSMKALGANIGFNKFQASYQDLPHCPVPEEYDLRRPSDPRSRRMSSRTVTASRTRLIRS
jgi:hypothetical protein